MRVRPDILIVTPFLADANNGNWRTAQRWQKLLTPQYRPIVTSDATAIPDRPALAIVLHARRGHESLLQLRERFPQLPLMLVLTGTDLYGDMARSAEAQESLNMADAVIVLQEDAIRFVPSAARRKTHVVFQSAPSLVPAAKPQGRLDCVVVGHLRAEKSPETIFDLVPLLRPDEPIHITHIGNGLDEALAARASVLKSARYHWVGGLPHGLTRAAIKRSHLLIHPSRIEGGANVIAEAVTAGTAVVASQMSGNVGMLGGRYDGYFPVGDTHGLLAILRKALAEPNYLSRLNTACKARAPLFDAREEARRLTGLTEMLLA